MKRCWEILHIRKICNKQVVVNKLNTQNCQRVALNRGGNFSLGSTLQAKLDYMLLCCKLLANQLPLVLPQGSYVRRTSRPIPLHGGERCASSKRMRAKQANPSRYTFFVHRFHD